MARLGGGSSEGFSFIQNLSGAFLPNYEVKKGRLYYKDRLVLPRNSVKIPTLLKEFHDSC